MLDILSSRVYNFEMAIRGMRHPLESYDKSDSEFFTNGNLSLLGKNDKSLMRKLRIAGTDHRKFLRQILVSVDVKAPLYWWKEADTYKVGMTSNSTSTMHSIHKKPFTLDMFSFDGGCEFDNYDDLIGLLEDLRKEYLKTNDKKYWRSLIQLLPSAFYQTRVLTLNYEVLLNMYNSRVNHKLSEWHTFCDWIEGLPYFKEICLGDDK